MINIIAFLVFVFLFVLTPHAQSKRTSGTPKSYISSASTKDDGKRLFPKRANKSKKSNLETIPLQAVLSSATKSAVSSTSKASTSESVNSYQRGMMAIIGGALAHMTLGTIYCWGNLMSYSPEKLKFFDGKSHPGSQPDALLVIPLTLVAQCITVPFGPTIANKIGARQALLLGSWTMALGVYLASYFTENLKIFMLFYCLLFGLGVGMGYTAPMLAGYKWLPQSKGMVSGGILAGYGLGGFFFNLIGTSLVNPKSLNPINGKFPSEVYANFPNMLRKLSMIYMGLSLFGSMLVTEPVPVIVKDPKKKVAVVEIPGVTVTHALHSRQFWQLWLLIVSAASCGLNIANIYKQFAGTSSVLAGDSFQALVGGLGAVFNGGGRLFWGTISDKIGVKTSFLILTVFQAFLQLAYPYGAKSKTLFAAFTCASYFCLAGAFSLAPPAAQKLFGPKYGTTIYGIVYSAFGLAAIGGQVVSKALLSKFAYDGMFKVFAVVSLIAAVLAHFLKPLASYALSTV